MKEFDFSELAQKRFSGQGLVVAAETGGVIIDMLYIAHFDSDNNITDKAPNSYAIAEKVRSLPEGERYLVAMVYANDDGSLGGFSFVTSTERAPGIPLQ